MKCKFYDLLCKEPDAPTVFTRVLGTDDPHELRGLY